MEELYYDIYKHYEKCFEENGDNNKGVDWPKIEDVDVRYKVMLECMKFSNISNGETKKNTLLDLGCGLGHTYKYILENKIDVDYSGMDISEKFVEVCNKKYPDISFECRDILKKGVGKKYDYIIMNGVFTEKLNLSYDQMWEFFCKMIKTVYDSCNCGLAFNVMSKDVDWEREDLFHVPLNQLSSWLTKNLTRKFIIRYDYGMYEYTVYVYRES